MINFEELVGKPSKPTKNGKTRAVDDRSKKQVDIVKERGNLHFKREEYCKAIECYKEGLALEPTNVHLNSNLAQAHLALSEFLDAEAHALITLANQDNFPKAFYRAAKAAVGMAGKDRALCYLEKGLVKCPQAEELKCLYNDIKQEDEGTASPPNKKTKSDNENVVNSTPPDKRNERDPQNKQRSRSAGGHPPNDKAPCDQRSTSVSRLTIENKSKKKKNKGPIEAEMVQKDQFLNLLTEVKNDIPPDEIPPEVKEREALKEKKEKLQVFMKEGSVALKNGLARQASEKYKDALQIMNGCNIEVFGMSEVDRIVLKYSLSLSWIDTLNYGNIVQSIGFLEDIETNHAAKLPAVYYGLGYAFYKLNRSRIALLHLEKGIQIIEKNLKITAHPWPGTMNTINETTKIGLEESLCTLVNNCKIYREPDAICRYESCLSINTHISPSENIFYSDPDFIGYVVVICQESCKITYHVCCWKDYKEKQPSVKKLSDKDMLGLQCLTSDCVTPNNEQSVIIRIEIYGDDGNLKAHCDKDPVKNDVKQDHTKKEKKKKVEKAPKPRPLPRKRNKTVENQNCVKKAKLKVEISRDELARYLRELDDFRKTLWNRDCYWDPRRDYFGQECVSTLKTYLNPQLTNDSEILRERKDFIYTYFFEYLNEEGPKKLYVLEKKWKDEVSQFHGVNEFMSPSDGICDFLLQSYRFASVDDYMCLVNQLSTLYLTVQIEIAESTLFIVSGTSFTVKAQEAGAGKINGLNEVNDLKTDETDGTVPAQVYWPNHSMDIFCSDSDDDESEDNESDITSGGGDLGSECQIDEPYDANRTEIVRGPTQNSCSESSSFSENHLEVEQEPVNTSEVEADNLHSCDERIDNPTLTQQSQFEEESVQTEGPNYQSLYEALDVENSELRNEIKTYREINKALTAEVQSAAKIIDEKEKRRIKLESATASFEKQIHEQQLEITKKDGKIETMKKKLQAQEEKYTKKLQENSSLVTENLAAMDELSTKAGNLEASLKRATEHSKKTSEESLNTRKDYGKFMLDSYLTKTKDNLESMDRWMAHLDASPLPAFLQLKDTLLQYQTAWKNVEKQLEDSRALLEVQHEILTQQTRSNVSADCLLQLELPELPKEPPNFNKFMEDIVLSGLQQAEAVIKDKKFPEIITLPNGTSSQNGPPPLGTSFQTPHMQGQDLFMQPFRFQKPPYYNEHFTSTPFIWPSSGAFNGFGPSHIPRFPAPIDIAAPSTSVPVINAPPTSGEFSSTFKASSTEHILQPIGPPMKIHKEPNEKNVLLTKDIQHYKSAECLQSGDSGAKGTFARKLSSAAGLIPIERPKQGLPQESKESAAPKSVNLSQKRWNYQKLFEELQKHFRTKSEVELSECLCAVREKNGNKLSGLTVPTIIRRVEKVLEEKLNRKVGNMGMDKFGGTAWGELKSTDVNWSNDDVVDECIICHVNMDTDKTTLQCKHTFHTECIRKWLHTNSTCPICRKYTRLVDEFPPLYK